MHNGYNLKENVGNDSKSFSMKHIPEIKRLKIRLARNQ